MNTKKRMRKALAVTAILTVLIGGGFFLKNQMWSSGHIWFFADSGRTQLMELKTDDYLDRTVEAFNEDFKPLAHLYDGFGRREKEPTFMKALFRSSLELAAEECDELPSVYLGRQCGIFELEYKLEWDVDPQLVTVGRREEVLDACESAVAAVFSAKSGDELRQDDALSQLQAELDYQSMKLSRDNLEVKLVAQSISIL